MKLPVAFFGEGGVNSEFETNYFLFCLFAL